jgi:hypothetical protein
LPSIFFWEREQGDKVTVSKNKPERRILGGVGREESTESVVRGVDAGTHRSHPTISSSKGKVSRSPPRSVTQLDELFTCPGDYESEDPEEIDFFDLFDFFDFLDG